MKKIVIITILLIGSLSLMAQSSSKFGISGDEYICIEFYDSGKFGLSISSCGKDDYIEGTYRKEDNDFYLTTKAQPKMKIKKPTPFRGPPNQKVLYFTSKDALLLPNIKLAINGGKWQNMPTNGMINIEEPVEKLQLKYPELEAITQDFSNPTDRSRQIEVLFDGVRATSFTDQHWVLNKKKLTLNDPEGQTVKLLKTKMCWFEYE